jgi:hypothetical protein
MLWFALQFSDAGSVAMNLAIGEAPPVFASNVALVAPAVAWFIMFFTPLRHLYSFFPIKVQLPPSSPLRHVPCWGPDIVCMYPAGAVHLGPGDLLAEVRSECVCVLGSAMGLCGSSPALSHRHQHVDDVVWRRCVCLGVGMGISRFPNSFVTPIILAVFGGTAEPALAHNTTRHDAHAHTTHAHSGGR